MNFNAANTRQRKLQADQKPNTTMDPRKMKRDHQGDQQPQPYGVYGAPPNYNPYMAGGYDPNTGAYNNAYGASPPQAGYGQPMPPGYQQVIGVAMSGMSDPMASAALHYGQALVGQGKQAVNKEIQRYVPVEKLKYYFAVDTSYVTRKLALLLVPFAHKDWSLKYEAESQPVQPRYEINAPDLYIPVMAYVTYVLVAGLILGTQNRFTPEVLGIQASSALAWVLLELALVWISMYVMNVQSQLKTLDLLAYGGYKFVGIIVSVLLSLLFKSAGYWIALCYCSLALGFFLIRSLKCQLLPETSAVENDPYSGHQNFHQSSPGTKRRLYLLMMMAGLQTLIMWRLSAHLVSP